jgi:Domain of unknown function (DUF4398)
MLLRSLSIPAAALACGLASGCASEGPEPREDMAQARTLVDQADKANAQRYAPADVQRAHDELNSAERDYGAKKYNEARADAESAAADADLATARASAGSAQHAATEVTHGNETLRQETQRDASGAEAQPPPQ